MTGRPDPARWLRLRPLLEEALDLDAAARAERLAHLRAEDPALANDLARLLAHHERTDALTGDAAQRVALPLLAGGVTGDGAAALGRRVGPYVLRRLVGEGGMGAVYEAERVEGGFEQRVAIKVIGGFHPGLIERFARERQILADLRHPGIPLLLDGGQTADGLPYLVQEFVDGQPLLDHVAAHASDLDARLDLLIQLAEAIGYAHSRKVLHRDIKPSNVLVTAEGRVKLLDFGIAKLLEATRGQTLTRHAVGPMTPAYAAPEQFRGGSLGVATDIYQFGVLMFRVLAGASPYALDEDAENFAAAVCEMPPRRLGAAWAEPAGLTRRRVERQRRADLERIVACCLAKAPSERYASMQQLIDDLAAVRVDGVPSVRRKAQRRRLLTGLAAGFAGLGLVLAVPRLAGLRSQAPADWSTDPALNGLGIDVANIHPEHPATVDLIRRALLADARGDVADAMALLESAHASDALTPVPALLIAYLASPSMPPADRAQWRIAAQQRLALADDAYLELFARLVAAEGANDRNGSMRYAAAMLDLKPQAWFLRVGRSHYLKDRNLTEAALRELQLISAPSLAHHRLVNAIADRASFGDPAGARAAADQLETPPSNPYRAMLEARLAWTASDFGKAQSHLQTAIAGARTIAQFEIESRALLMLGLVQGTLGQPRVAEASLREARERLELRKAYNSAVDASLVLGQLAAFDGDRATIGREIAYARALRTTQGAEDIDPLIEIHAARLLGTTPAIPRAAPFGAVPLVEAWAAVLAGDRDAARQALARADAAGVLSTRHAEESVLLRRALGDTEPALLPYDPPFQPYSRCAGRWALGISVVGETPAWPATRTAAR
jgi:hypothetical protein